MKIKNPQQLKIAADKTKKHIKEYLMSDQYDQGKSEQKQQRYDIVRFPDIFSSPHKNKHFLYMSREDFAALSLSSRYLVPNYISKKNLLIRNSVNIYPEAWEYDKILKSKEIFVDSLKNLKKIGMVNGYYCSKENNNIKVLPSYVLSLMMKSGYVETPKYWTSEIARIAEKYENPDTVFRLFLYILRVIKIRKFQGEKYDVFDLDIHLEEINSFLFTACLDDEKVFKEIVDDIDRSLRCLKRYKLILKKEFNETHFSVRVSSELFLKESFYYK